MSQYVQLSWLPPFHDQDQLHSPEEFQVLAEQILFVFLRLTDPNSGFKSMHSFYS
jgi:hypothetical protein